MRTIEVSSTSIEKATEKGLMLLDTTRENVEVKVLEENATLKKFKIEMTVFDNEDERQEYLKANAPKVEVKRERKEKPYNAELAQEALKLTEEFLQGLLNATGFKYTLSVVENDQEILASINGDEMGRLIGHHGEAMECIQLLLNSYIKKNCPGYDRRVYIDIESYRAKRENTIVDLGLRLANKVVKNRASIKLEPMNRYERKVIHNALQNKAHVATHSEGEEPNRCLVIDYVE